MSICGLYQGSISNGNCEWRFSSDDLPRVQDQQGCVTQLTSRLHKFWITGTCLSARITRNTEPVQPL